MRNSHESYILKNLLGMYLIMLILLKCRSRQSADNTLTTGIRGNTSLWSPLQSSLFHRGTTEGQAQPPEEKDQDERHHGYNYTIRCQVRHLMGKKRMGCCIIVDYLSNSSAGIVVEEPKGKRDDLFHRLPAHLDFDTECGKMGDGQCQEIYADARYCSAGSPPCIGTYEGLRCNRGRTEKFPDDQPYEYQGQYAQKGTQRRYQ